MRPFVTLLAALVLSLGPAALGAQAARLDSTLRAVLEPAFERARRDSVPLEILEAKAAEGLAKRRPQAQIVAVVTQLASDVASARAMLRRAAPDAVLPAQELVAAADAIRLGVPEPDIEALRRTAPGQVVLDIPFSILGALVERGVPAGAAQQVIREMITADVPQGRMVELPARLDIALRVGAGPTAALNSALQGLGIPVGPLPVPPVDVPGRPPGQSGNGA